MCDEIKQIEITLHVDKCDLVKTNHNLAFPVPADTDYQSALGQGRPLWHIKTETTWKPVLDHPTYWIDKFYPAIP